MRVTLAYRWAFMCLVYLSMPCRRHLRRRAITVLPRRRPWCITRLLHTMATGRPRRRAMRRVSISNTIAAIQHIAPITTAITVRG